MLTNENPIRSQRIRDAARGQRCAVRLPEVCCYDDSTTVLAHFSYATRGMGIKSPDISAAFCCHACHEVVDGHAKRPRGLLREDIEWCKARGMAETWGRLVELGIIKIAGVA